MGGFAGEIALMLAIRAAEKKWGSSLIQSAGDEAYGEMGKMRRVEIDENCHVEFFDLEWPYNFRLFYGKDQKTGGVEFDLLLKTTGKGNAKPYYLTDVTTSEDALRQKLREHEQQSHLASGHDDARVRLLFVLLTKGKMRYSVQKNAHILQLPYLGLAIGIKRDLQKQWRASEVGASADEEEIVT